ncbi:ankyrin repeat domain-containing protein [Mesorhizobium sp. M0045]|uniref:ankyrin repeat domain-containing protein n=1 Tax=unclassified Mesorhizobium TaxID=325217 RepID=UPI00333CDAA1
MSNPDGPAPVHKAVMRHSSAEVIQAISEGKDVDALDREGRTPLFYASKDGETAIVAALIERGAKVNVQDKNLETPLHFAAREYRLEVAELLVKGGADVSSQDIHGNTPLWRAVFESRGRGELIKLLLSAGSDKTLKNKLGCSPQDLAKTIGNYDINAFLG